MSDYASSKFKLWAVIEGKTIDCSSYEANFALNTVPTASINLALGREVNSLTPSAAHDLTLTRKIKVKVYWEATNLPGTFKEKWKNGTQLMFDGDVVGAGYSKSQAGSASLSLALQHWLGRLGSGSCISGTSHPSNSADLTFDTTSPQNLCGVLGAHAGPPNTDILEFIQKGLASDLWEDGLKPWFKCLAQQETLDTHNLIRGVNRRSDRPDLIPALDRIKSSVPIKLNGANSTALTEAIASSISAKAKTPQDIYSATMWDVLVGIASEYYLAIVPCIDVVYLVPYIPGLRKPYGTVAGGDFGQFGYQAGLSKPWRAVGLLGAGLASAHGALTSGGAASRKNCLGGWFENPDSPNGLIVYKPLPDWMDGPQSEGYAASTVGAGGRVKATALHPKAGAEPKKDAPDKAAEAQKDLRDAFAQCVYVEEALRSRQTSISEQRLRTDLAPGSTVSVEAVGEPFIKKDKTSGTIYGTISQVTIALNADAGGAGTAYQISNVRNKEENTNDAMSVANHPLWANSFFGVPLQ